MTIFNETIRSYIKFHNCAQLHKNLHNYEEGEFNLSVGRACGISANLKIKQYQRQSN